MLKVNRQTRCGLQAVYLLVLVHVLMIHSAVSQQEFSGSSGRPASDHPEWHTRDSDRSRPSDQIPRTNDDRSQEHQGEKDDHQGQKVTGSYDSSPTTEAGFDRSTRKVDPLEFSDLVPRASRGQGQGDPQERKVTWSQDSLTTTASFGGAGKTAPLPLTGSWRREKLRSTVDKTPKQWSETPARITSEWRFSGQESGAPSDDKLPSSPTSGYYYGEQKKMQTSAGEFGTPRSSEDSYSPQTADSQNAEALNKRAKQVESADSRSADPWENDTRKTNETRTTETTSPTTRRSADALARMLTTLNSMITTGHQTAEVTNNATMKNGSLDSSASATVREISTNPAGYNDETNFSTALDLDRPASSDMMIQSVTEKTITNDSKPYAKSDSTAQIIHNRQPRVKPDNETSHRTGYFQTQPKSDNRTSQDILGYDYMSRTDPGNLTHDFSHSLQSWAKSETVTTQASESFQRPNSWQFRGVTPGENADRDINWTPPQPSEDDQRSRNSTLRTDQNITTSLPARAENATTRGDLVITKLKGLHEGKLDSDLLYKAVELGDGITMNSTTDADEEELDALTAGGNKEIGPVSNSSDADKTLTESAAVDVNDDTSGAAELKQFHVPDDDCLYDVYGASGSLKFPDAERFPVASNYSGLVTCRWRVRVPQGPNVKLSVQRLALSLGVEQLEVAVGMDGELKKRAFTGSKVPRDLVTVGTRLWLTAKVRNDGYKDKIVLSFAQSAEEATFPKDDNYTCGAILSDLSGNITSPGYADQGHYENNQECAWYIVGPAQSVIRLTVIDFSTDVYDHLTMGIGLHAGTGSSRLLTLYGKLREERQTVIPASSLWIHFASDDSVTDRGFLLSYTVVPREICNISSILTSQEGLITSINYPRLYPINSECTWYIRAPPNSYVNITFFDFLVEDGRDFLLIGEGTELFGGSFETLTGNGTDSNPMRVDSSNVWIHFTSDHLNGPLPYRGFSLSYQLHYHPEVKAEVTSPGPLDEENMVEQKQDQPMNDQGEGNVITIPLTGVKEKQLERSWKKFRLEVTRVLNDHCLNHLQDKCSGKHRVTEDAITLLGARRDQGRLLVEVRVEADVNWPAHAMAATDYEELERLFHSDLQSLDLKNADSSDDLPSNLPEWLIGVIVLIILLIVAFFAMVIYSLMKERKKNRAGSYEGTTSSATGCEDLEVGKADSNIRITAFSLEQGDGKEIAEGLNGQAGGPADTNGAAWTLDAEVASTLQRRQHGVSGCMNPAFIDEDAAADEKDNEEVGRGRKDGAERDNTTTPTTTTTTTTTGHQGQDGTKNPKHEPEKAAAAASSSFSSSTTTTTKPNGNTVSAVVTTTNVTSSSSCPKVSPESPTSQLINSSTGGGEHLEMNENVTSSQGQGQGQGQSQGHAEGKLLNNLSPKDSSDETETSVDDAGHDGDRENKGAVSCRSSEGGAIANNNNNHHHDRAGLTEPSTSSSSSGPRQLEVVLDRDTPASDPQACVMVHMDKDGKQGDMENVRESSTDEKDGPGMSTNL